MFLLDTNVFFSVFKGHVDLTNWLAGLPDTHIDTVIYIECIQGNKANAEKRVIKRVLDAFPCLPLTPAIGARALKLIDQYSNSYNLLLPDALIAASALENGLSLITYNLKDFQFIAGLSVSAPPFPQI